MGSGETSPTMVATHRELFGRLGEEVAAVLLETPYAFQENKAEISAKARRYFGDSVGRAVFASAAACTIGTRALPVYEIYKVGQPPSWLEGLDLVGAAGLRVAVIPHFDNAEGGTHDTRYCYMGERRLRALEDQLADDTAILGVDEHTAAVLDLDAQVLTVSGRGGVTLRRRGRQWTWPSGATVALDELRQAATGSGGTGGGPAPSPPTGHASANGPRHRPRRSRSRCCRRWSTAPRPRSTAPWSGATPPAWWRRSSTSTAPSWPGRPTPCSPTTSTGPTRCSARWSCGSARPPPPGSATLGRSSP